MPRYRVNLTYLGVRNGITEKQFYGTFADNAAAVAARAAIVNAAAAITGAHILKSELTEITEYAGSPVAGYVVTDRVSASMFLDQATAKKYNLVMPSPISTILTPGNTLDSGQAIWQTFIDTLTAAGSGWEVSDGEHIDNTGANGTIGGKLISVRSGVRTLPTA